MKNALPLVSLITPSLNQAQYLESAIQSVLNQDYPNIEHIIIDGGSTDGTLDIIHKYEHHWGYWVSEKDTGSSDAINKGWQKAKGEYVWVLNSDDLLVAPNAISILVDFLENYPDITFAYGDLYYINDQSEIIGYKEFSDYTVSSLVLNENRYPFPGCLMRRDVLNTVGYFDKDILYANDLDYFIRIALQHKMGHVKQFTGYF